MRGTPKPITIRGKTYPSKASAARALGITYKSLQKAVVAGRVQTVGIDPRGKNHGRQVEIDGRVYVSIAEASRATGVNYEKMRSIAKA